VPRELVSAQVTLGDRRVDVSSLAPVGGTPTGWQPEPLALDDVVAPTGPESVSVPLVRLCLARSGDKGDTSNVGVIARSPAIYRWLLETLTDEVVRQHFKGVCHGDVERHPMPNLSAVNFLLHESLGGGGTSSLRFDAQGKTYAQYLLSMYVTVPVALLATVG
jgi:hypothetical protein